MCGSSDIAGPVCSDQHNGSRVIVLHNTEGG